MTWGVAELVEMALLLLRPVPATSFSLAHPKASVRLSPATRPRSYYPGHWDHGAWRCGRRGSSGCPPQGGI